MAHGRRAGVQETPHHAATEAKKEAGKAKQAPIPPRHMPSGPLGITGKEKKQFGNNRIFRRRLAGRMWHSDFRERKVGQQQMG